MDLAQELSSIAGADNVFCDEPMKNHTTFQIGGAASYYVTPKNKEELIRLAALCREQPAPFCVIGNGSNLLVSDDGYDGVVISTGKLSGIVTDGDIITADAGILLSRLAREAAGESLTGLEFAAGIPGSLGGALVMNAGAYGSEIKDVLVSALILKEDGSIEDIPAEDLKLGYRSSSIPKEGYIVLEATVRLKRADKDEIFKTMEDLSNRRRLKQPLEYPSAGSTFKRPEGYYAGKLIEDAGFRGYSVGGAQVSEKHCGFVINRDHATAADVMALCDEISTKVEDEFGVRLEMEVKRLGDI